MPSLENDPNLYFSTEGPISINAPQPIVTPQGQVVYAGTKWGSRATYAHAPPPDFMRPTPHYLVVYTLEGTADYVDETGVQTVMREGSLLWTAPGVHQSYGPRGNIRWSEFFMWFSGPVFDAWQAAGIPGAASLHLRLLPVAYWLDCFRTLLTPETESDKPTPLLRLCRLQTLLAEALQANDARRHSEDAVAWREEACRLLREGTLTQPSLEEVARTLNVSYSLFRKRFRQLTGKTPAAFRAEAVMHRASLRLMNSEESIAQIAECLGFSDAFHFSRRFKQATGMSPSDFRTQAAS